MRAKILLMVGILAVGFWGAQAYAAEIQTARDLATAALKEVSDFNKHLDVIGRKAFIINTSCRNARALIDRKRANLNGLAVQAIQKSIAQKEAVAALFPDLLDFLPLIDLKVQSVALEIEALTQDGDLNPFRSNAILDKLSRARALLPTMGNNIQSLSEELSVDLTQAFEDGLSALESDDSLAAREAMNRCLSILRDFEKRRKLIGQVQRGRVTKLLSDSKLLMRQTGPIGVLAELSVVGAASAELRIYRIDGRLWIKQALISNSDSHDLGPAVKALANGVYLAVVDLRDAHGRIIKAEMKKILISK